MKNLLFGVILLTVMTTGYGQKKSVYIEGYDRMKYSVEEIRVKPGMTVELTLKTISDLPKSQMAHDWVLLHQGVDAKKFVNASMVMKDNDYIDPDLKDEIIAATGMLGGGEQQTITFQAPEKKGEYMYVCTFPGHFIAGMKGKLIVE